MDDPGNILTNRPYRVLALDGGGMRGLYTATVLDTLAARFARERGTAPLDVGRGFDLITGTSTGGLLACALASGLPSARLVAFYGRYGPQIFTNPTPQTALRRLFWTIRCLGRPANSSAVLRAALEETFGDETLAEVYERRRIGLCITAVNLETQAGRVFKTPHHSPLKQRDNNWTLSQVCMATSAAPIYLPVAQCKDPDASGDFVFVDGGLLANNPALIGLIEALSVAPEDRPIEVLSIGTCSPPDGLPVRKSPAQWGLAGWGTKVLTTTLNVQAQSCSDVIALLLPHLKRKCSVVRLPQTAPSAEQARFLGLDSVSTAARRVLQTLGKRDADIIHSKALQEDNTEMSSVARIFHDMPTFD